MNSWNRIAALVSKGNLLHDTDRTAEADQLMLGLLDRKSVV